MLRQASEEKMVGIYLMFNGKCVDALNLYEKAFSIKTTEIKKYGDMPPNPNFPVPDDKKGLILHSRLVLEGMDIMCSDSSSETQDGDNMYISITTKDEKMVKEAFNVLKDDGTVFMELQPSFFALYHGSLKDKFGVNWMFTVSK
jgi:PhnB protein